MSSDITEVELSPRTIQVQGNENYFSEDNPPDTVVVSQGENEQDIEEQPVSEVEKLSEKEIAVKIDYIRFGNGELSDSDIEAVYESKIPQLSDFSLNFKGMMRMLLVLLIYYGALIELVFALTLVINITLQPAYSLIYFLRFPEAENSGFFAVANGIGIIIIIIAIPQILSAAVSFTGAIWTKKGFERIFSVRLLSWLPPLAGRIVPQRVVEKGDSDYIGQWLVFIISVVYAFVACIIDSFTAILTHLLMGCVLTMCFLSVFFIVEYFLITYTNIVTINAVLVGFHVTENRSLVKKCIERKGLIFKLMMIKNEAFEEEEDIELGEVPAVDSGKKTKTKKPLAYRSRWKCMPRLVSFIIISPILAIFFICPFYVLFDIWSAPKNRKLRRSSIKSVVWFWFIMLMGLVYTAAVSFVFYVVFQKATKTTSLLVTVIAIWPCTPFIYSFLASSKRLMKETAKIGFFFGIIIGLAFLFFAVGAGTSHTNEYPELGNATLGAMNMRSHNLLDFSAWMASSPYPDLDLPGAGEWSATDAVSMPTAYPICGYTYYNMSVMDFLALSYIAYEPSLFVGYPPLQNDDWEVIGHGPEDYDGYFIDYYSPSRKLSIIALRGTNSNWDIIQDASIYGEAAVLEFVNTLFPFASILPERYQSFLVKSMSFVETIYGDDLNSYDAPIVNYYNNRTSVDIERTVFTGHSLAGGLAQLGAVKTDNKAIVFSSPGMLFTSTKFDVDFGDLESVTVNINPRADIVARVDHPAGCTQRIDCDASALSAVECHLLGNTMVTMGKACINSDILYFRDQTKTLSV
ncbi:hypothetical protein PCE1_002042 [Barthelona sp. PCE]